MNAVLTPSFASAALLASPPKISQMIIAQPTIPMINPREAEISIASPAKPPISITSVPPNNLQKEFVEIVAPTALRMMKNSIINKGTVINQSIYL